MHAALLLLLSLPYFINLQVSSIWDTNEAFYAETPREMLVTGNYLAPMFNHQIRAQKPPLTYWAILLSYKLFGVHEFAVRLPGALAALGVLLFSYAAASMLFGSRAALIAAAIAATTPRIFILVRRLPIDILLLFFLTGTLYFLVRALRKGEAWSWALAYISASLGFLTKGPVALVVPAATCLAWMFLSRKLKISAMRPLMGALIFVLIASPWYIFIYRAYGWTYISPFFLRDNLGRFALRFMGPARGPFYYVGAFAVDFFPWSLLFLSALFLLWKKRKKIQPLKQLSFGFPLVWCAVIFLLFSLSKNKQEYYIAPMYPAAAVVLSGAAVTGMRKRKVGDAFEYDREFGPQGPAGPSKNGHDAQTSWWVWPYGIQALLLFLLSILTPYFIKAFLPSISLYLRYLPSLILVSGFGYLTFSIVRKKQLHCLFAVAISRWAVFMIAAVFYVPALEAFRPVRHFCRIIKSEIRGNEEAGYFGTALPSMAFYLERPIFQESSYERMMDRFSSGERVFCVLPLRDYESFAEKGLKIRVLDRRFRFSVKWNSLFHAGYDPGEELLLVSNGPFSNPSLRQ